MSHTLLPVNRSGFAVPLGNLTFHATSWRMEAVRTYAEQNTIGGAVYVTNSGMHARRLILNGFFCFDDQPADILLALDSAMSQNTRFVFSLRGVRLLAAILTEYSIEEQAKEGVLPCRLVLITGNGLSAAPTTDTTEMEGTS